MVVSVNGRNGKPEKRILKKHSINFNIVKKRERKKERRDISKVYREHMYSQTSEELGDALLLFPVASYPWCTYRVDGITVVKLYFYFA